MQTTHVWDPWWVELSGRSWRCIGIWKLENRIVWIQTAAQNRTELNLRKTVSPVKITQYVFLVSAFAFCTLFILLNPPPAPTQLDTDRKWKELGLVTRDCSNAWQASKHKCQLPPQRILLQSSPLDCELSACGNLKTTDHNASWNGTSKPAETIMLTSTWPWCILISDGPYEPRSKFIVYVQCVILLVSPLSFYGFPVFTYFVFFEPLLKHSLEARPLGSSSLAIFVCARWGALVLLPVPVWSSFALLGRSLQPAGLLERKWVLACFGHSQLLTSKFIQPGQKKLVHHYNILPTSTTCSACCVTSRSPWALLERI